MNHLADMLDGRNSAESTASAIIQRALEAVRRHLGMEVAYVSKFVGSKTIYREVDAPGLEALIKPGDSRPLDEVYCKHILEGRLPELIPDTAVLSFAMALPLTTAVPIGAQVSVPIILNDGQPYGMFCCLSPTANPTLNNRDLEMMRAFADLTAYQIETEIDASRLLDEKHARIEQAIKGEHSFRIVFQSIWDFDRNQPVGFECLTRFADELARAPDKWFNEAADVGRGPQLEIAAIQAALQAGCSLPEHAFVSVNTSPAAILSPGFADAFRAYPCGRIVLEVTEHAPVQDYRQLIDIFRAVLQMGIRLAVDDAGAGYSSFQHIIKLQPDVIKLDMELTRHIDADPARRALASALIRFAHETGYQIVAEGIETVAEMQTLERLGVTQGQGYLLGQPADLDAARALIDNPAAGHGISSMGSLSRSD